ncbi:hypothetical protein F5H01DRAFT_323862 [Linnemannia elongata]|nr:hypothetical protein F5H01DRAFT_323862 [Linnemannia elongata]
MHFRRLSFLLLATTFVPVAQATILTINFHPCNVNDSPFGVIVNNVDCEVDMLNLFDYNCRGDTCRATHKDCIRPRGNLIEQALLNLDRNEACTIKNVDAKEVEFDDFHTAKRGERCLFSVQQERLN